MIREEKSDLTRHGVGRAYGSEMLRTATPVRMRHLEQRLANDGYLTAKVHAAGNED